MSDEYLDPAAYDPVDIPGEDSRVVHGTTAGPPLIGDELVLWLLEHGTDEQRDALHTLADHLAIDLIEQQSAEIERLRQQLGDRST